MKRALATVAAAAGVLIWTGGMGAATHTATAQANSAHPHAHAHAAPTVKPAERPYNWAEDNLPVELYLWAGCNDGPCDYQREPGLFEGRRGCWTAFADTAATFCPTRDNKIAVVYYS